MLTWTASSGAASYRILRDGAQVGMTTATTYADSPTPADGAHEYAVVAVDAAGNASDTTASAALQNGQFTTPATNGTTFRTVTAGGTLGAWSVVSGSVDQKLTYWPQPPGGGYSVDLDGSAPGAIEQSFATTAGAQYRVLFAFSANGDQTGPRSMRVTAASATQDYTFTPPAGWSSSTLGWTYRTFTFTAAATSTTLRFASLSAAGNASGPAVGDISVSRVGGGTTVTVDTTAPSAPTLSATSPTKLAPALTWTSVADAASYQVLRGGVQIATTTSTTYTDTGRSDGGYAYTVRAVDAATNASAASNAVTVVVDATAPNAPTGLAAASPTNAMPALSWTAATEGGDPTATRSGVASYTVALNDGTILGTTTATSFAQPAPAADGSYTYYVRANDGAGNASGWASITVVLDTVAPAPPTGLVSTSPTAGAPAMSWTASSGATSYRIYRDGTLVGTTTGTSFQDPGPVTDGSLEYAVAAVDAAGNASSSAVPNLVTDGTFTVPAATGATWLTRSAGSTLGAWTVTGHSVDRVETYWQAPPGGGLSVDLDGSGPGGVEQTLTTVPGQAYRVAFAMAVNSDSGAGTVRSMRVWTGATFGDFSMSRAAGAPAAMGWAYRTFDFTATASTTVLRLESLSASGMTGVAVGDVSVTPVGATTVVAVDTVAPPAPTLTATSPTASAPALTWTQIGDATEYRVFRGGSQIATVAGGATTTYTDSGRSDGSYSYTVKAVDAAGNASAASAAVSVVVDATAPSKPTGVAGTSPTASAPAITWTASSDAASDPNAATAGVASYRILRDGALVGTSTTTSYTDSTAGNGTYVYTVQAVDGAGNASAASTSSATILHDTVAPTVPSGVAASSPTAQPPALTWTASTDAGSGIALYRIYRASTGVGTVLLTSHDGLLHRGHDPGRRHLHLHGARGRRGGSSCRRPRAPSPSSSTRPRPRRRPASPRPRRRRRRPRSPGRRRATAAGAASSATASPATARPSARSPARRSPTRPPRRTARARTRCARSTPPATSRPRSRSTSTSIRRRPARRARSRRPPRRRRRPSLSWTASSGAVSYRISRDGTQIATQTATTFTDAAQADGSHTYSVVAVNRAGTLSSPAAVIVVVDATAPTAPTALAATASATAGAPSLTWTAATDAGSSVVRYDIYRAGAGAGGVKVGSATGTSHSDAAALADGSYTYTVRAVDAAGNVGSASSSTAVLVDTVAPSAPSGLAATTPTRVAPALTWTAATDAGAGILRYRIRRDGTQVATRTTATYTDPDALADGSYAYDVIAEDAAGNLSAASTAVTVVLDTAAPATPAAPTASSPTNAAPALTWAAVSGAATYRVLRDGTVVDTVATTSWVEPGSLADGSYAYALVAVDAAGNASAASTTTAVQLDTVPPSAPSGLAATSPTASAPALSWTASTSSSGAISQYRVYRNGAPIAIRNVASYTDTATLADGSYTYTVTRYDLALNESAQSAPLTVVIDRTSPGSPTDLAATSPTAAAPALSWTAPAADATGIASYRVYRDSTLVGSPTGTSFTDALPADGTYAYVVRAVDGAGNLSPVTSISVTVDTVAPPTPAAPSLTTPTASLPSLAWSASSGATSYRVLRDGAVVATTASTTWTETAALADGTYAYAVSAVDAAGNASAASSASTVVLDRAAPSAVTGLAATSPTASAPSLSWTAATDATSGVALYRVLRDGVEIGTTTSLGYVDAASIADGVHGYDVIAVDAAGNASAAASIAVTVDTVAPAAVVGLGREPDRERARALLDGVERGLRLPRAARRHAHRNRRHDHLRRHGDARRRRARVRGRGGRRRGQRRYREHPRDRGRPHRAERAGGPRRGDADRERAGPHLERRDGCHERRRAVHHRARRAGDRRHHGHLLHRPDAPRRRHPHLRGAGRGRRRQHVVGGDVRRRRRHLDPRHADEPRRDVAHRRGADPLLDGTRRRRELPHPAGRHADRDHRLDVLHGRAAPRRRQPHLRRAGGQRRRHGLRQRERRRPRRRDRPGDAGPDRRRLAHGRRAGHLLAGRERCRERRHGLRRRARRRRRRPARRHELHRCRPRRGRHGHVPRARGGRRRQRVRLERAARRRLRRDCPLDAQRARCDLADADGTRARVERGDGRHLRRRALPRAAGRRGARHDHGDDPRGRERGRRRHVRLRRRGRRRGRQRLGREQRRQRGRRCDRAGSTERPRRHLADRGRAVPLLGRRDGRGLRARRLPRAPGRRARRDRRHHELDGRERVRGLHVYAIRALDQAGNVSAASATVTVVLDATAPAAPSGLAAPSPTAGAPVLGWTAPAADAGTAVAAYRVLRDGSLVATVGTTGYTDAASLADGSHAYVVRAVDAAGNVSADASVAVVVDATAPSAVGALAAATPTGTLPVLTWSAATDATSGIDRYLIARDGTIIATTTARTYRDVYDDPSMADGVYVYMVTAEDRAGNRGAAATVTVLVDQTAPSTPGDLAAATPTSSAPALAWSPSSDGGSGVASYRVLRDGAVIATVNGTSFVDASVGDGTYQYAVRAVDAAGNASGLASLEVIVDTTTPGDPGSLTATSPTASAPSLTWSAARAPSPTASCATARSSRRPPPRASSTRRRPTAATSTSSARSTAQAPSRATPRPPCSSTRRRPQPRPASPRRRRPRARPP